MVLLHPCSFHASPGLRLVLSCCPVMICPGLLWPKLPAHSLLALSSPDCTCSPVLALKEIHGQVMYKSQNRSFDAVVKLPPAPLFVRCPPIVREKRDTPAAFTLFAMLGLVATSSWLVEDCEVVELADSVWVSEAPLEECSESGNDNVSERAREGK